MKIMFRIMLLVTAIFAFTCSVSAQQRRDGGRISREQLAEKQAKYIAEELRLSTDETEKFITTYLKCQREVWALGPRQTGKPNRSMTDSQTDSVIQARFDHSQKILNIRRKYYVEYSKFLTSKQIERAYELERQMMKRLSERRNSRRR